MISWVSIGESIYGARFAAPQNGLSSNMMALMTSDCGAMRLPEHQRALIASGCAQRCCVRSQKLGNCLTKLAASRKKAAQVIIVRLTATLYSRIQLWWVRTAATV